MLVQTTSIAILVIGTVIISSLYLSGKMSLNTKDTTGASKALFKNIFTNKKDSQPKPEKETKVEPYILTPTEFKVGSLPVPKTFANLCGNNTVLYPIQGLGPRYGLPKIPDDCPCLQFMQAP